jgi:isoleucyl-tRNA synthetase
MSKSLGNVIAPRKVADTLGAEVIRLWVASTDYSGELSISDEILKRVVEGYRRVRNTLRFLLANTSDFDPAKDALAPERWVEVDRYALAMTRAMADACIADYKKFEFHTLAQRLQNFCSEDILKDRLYTAGRDSQARRSAQSALHLVTQMLLRLMAPILSFTAEEAWEILHPRTPGAPAESIFFHTWKDVLPAQAGEMELIERWQRIRAIRSAVVKRLEESRAAGEIGSSLQAQVEVLAPGGDLALLHSLGDDLKFVLITSKAIARDSAAGELEVRVVPSPFAKCERCWHWRDDVGIDAAHPAICGRCIANLEGPGEARRHA